MMLDISDSALSLVSLHWEEALYIVQHELLESWKRKINVSS